MSWREAFLQQARSDAAVWQRLNQDHNTEYSHELHYFQMVTEKLSKAILTPANSSTPPEMSHAVFVRCLQIIKGRPEIRSMLGYENNTDSYRAFIDSLIPCAEQIQRLAPAIAKTSAPNPEYPWQVCTGEPVISPAKYEFPEFEAYRSQLPKLKRLVVTLLKKLD